MKAPQKPAINDVGFMNQESLATGSTMIAPVFLSVSSSDGSYTLADLSVTGYAPYDEKTDKGGTSGEFWLQRLDASGKVADSDIYRWYDDDVKHGWYNSNGKTKIAKPEDVKFDAGEGIWCIGRGYSVVASGAVKLDELKITTRTTGSTPCGNGLPVGTTLDKVTVSGYDPYDEKTDKGGTSGELWLQFLDANGKVADADIYRWYDDDVKHGWYSSNGKTKIDGSKVPIDAGKGFWVIGRGYTIHIPAVFPEKEAAE